MMREIKAGLASAALVGAVLAMAPAQAADLGGYRGSIKDGYVAPPMPMAPASPACYFRSSVGYSITRDPSVEWTGTTFGEVSMSDGWLGEAAVGCGSASDRGLRGEVAFGYRGKRKIDAEIEATVTPIPPGDPLHTSVQSYTMMFNAYYDFGNHSGFVPYVGAGVGFAYNRMSATYFTNSPFTNSVLGNDQLNAAWAVMAGVEYKVSSRASVDVGYRFIDFGSVHSDHGDTGGFWNPRVKLDDLAAHEIMVGVRYKFCGPAC